MIGKNIVVLANQWNPSILTADWLNQHTDIKDFKTNILLHFGQMRCSTRASFKLLIYSFYGEIKTRSKKKYTE
jgi:hypothetical protein